MGMGRGRRTGNHVDGRRASVANPREMRRWAMRSRAGRSCLWPALALAGPVTSPPPGAAPRPRPALVAVSVEIDGGPASLYPPSTDRAVTTSRRERAAVRDGPRQPHRLAARRGAHRRRPQRHQRHAGGAARAHVRPRPVAEHDVRAGARRSRRSPVHVRRRAGVVRRAQRQVEPQDGLDRGRGPSRAVRRALRARRGGAPTPRAPISGDRPTKRTRPTGRRRPRSGRRGAAPTRCRPRPLAGPHAPIPGPGGASARTTLRCSSASSRKPTRRRRWRCGTSTGRRSWPSASCRAPRPATGSTSATARRAASRSPPCGESLHGRGLHPVGRPLLARRAVDAGHGQPGLPHENGHLPTVVGLGGPRAR